ncbi:MAG: hypothetical protein K2X48_00995 [Chitinophagaceae bacterium]|nr:hypothetical protein [Chitinophagaceae bacterium]
MVQQYWLHSYFAFKTYNNIWRKGELMILKKDSFYIRPTVVTLGLFVNDTARFPLEGYALHDVLMVPGKGLLIDYKKGKFQIIRSAGNVSFYWLKSGWILRAGAIGYTALTVINGLLNGDLGFSGNRLPVAAAVYASGFALKRLYKPVKKIGKAYKIKVKEF